MKRLIILLICCLLTTACTQQAPKPTDVATAPPVTNAPTQAAPTERPAEVPTQAPTESPVEPAPDTPVRFTIYTPNENADGFYDTVILMEERNAQNIVDELIKEKVLNEEIAINSERLEGSQLLLDFNSHFRDQLVTYGTAGERMMIGSVVNTFLSAYGAEAVMITVDGEILESGHVVYDFPLEFFN